MVANCVLRYDSPTMPGVNGQNLGGPRHNERRASIRYRPSSVAYVQLGTENGGVLLDVSETGLRLSAGETLGWDDAVPLSLQLSYRADPIQATGQIVWMSDSKRTAGLRFVSLPETSRAKLRDWIASEESRVNLPDAAKAPAAAGSDDEEDKPRRRPIDFPIPSPAGPSNTSDEKVERKRTRSERLWEALLDLEPLVDRQSREVPGRAARTQGDTVHDVAASSQSAAEQPVRKHPVLVPTPPLSLQQSSHRRNDTSPPFPSGSSSTIEDPEVTELPASKVKSASSKVTQLPSDRLFRKTAHPEDTPSPVEEPPSSVEAHAAPEQNRPEASPAAPAPPPSRWGRTEPSSAPAQASAAAPPSQTSGADSIRQAFQAKQAAEAHLPTAQASAGANSAVGVGQASLHDESSRLKFAEWARARGRSGPDFFVDDIHNIHNERRPSSLRGVLVGGLMLLCFAVGLVIGVAYLTGSINLASFHLPGFSDNSNEDTPAATQVPPSSVENSGATISKSPAKAPAGNPMPNANAALSPTPRATQNANPNSAATTAPATNNAANTAPANGSTAANAAPNTTSATSPELAAATNENATPPPVTQQQHAPQPVSPQQSTQQPAKPPAASADDTLAMSHAITVTPPAEGSPAAWVRLPRIALSASGSVAISVQQSVLVPPASTYGSARANQVIVGGRILSSSVQPLYSAVPIDPNGNVVHLRVWVDPQGDIRQIMPGEGRADLIALAEGEVRGWVQYPPRLTGKPIDSVEDVTITFRP